jgi:hypothetical protein
VRLDGADADVQLEGDLGVRAALADGKRNFTFARLSSASCRRASSRRAPISPSPATSAISCRATVGVNMLSLTAGAALLHRRDISA